MYPWPIEGYISLKNIYILTFLLKFTTCMIHWCYIIEHDGLISIFIEESKKKLEFMNPVNHPHFQMTDLNF
jgi:hypothetical protein